MISRFWRFFVALALMSAADTVPKFLLLEGSLPGKPKTVTQFFAAKVRVRETHELRAYDGWRILRANFSLTELNLEKAPQLMKHASRFRAPADVRILHAIDALKGEERYFRLPARDADEVSDGP